MRQLNGSNLLALSFTRKMDGNRCVADGAVRGRTHRMVRHELQPVGRCGRQQAEGPELVQANGQSDKAEQNIDDFEKHQRNVQFMAPLRQRREY